MTVVAEAPEITASTPEAEDLPIAHWDDLTVEQRESMIPLNLRHNIRSVEGHTAPFRFRANGPITQSPPVDETDPGWYPCPPVSPGDKIISIDGFDNPRPLLVVERKGDTVIGMHGAIKVRTNLWLRLAEDYNMPATPEPKDRLSKEESAKVEAEIEEWAKFLGKASVQHNWCSEYEEVCKRIGIKPFRPDYSKVVLRGQVPFKGEDLDALIKEKFGDGAVSGTTSLMVTVDVELKDVPWLNVQNGDYASLLAKSAHPDLIGYHVFSKEVAE